MDRTFNALGREWTEPGWQEADRLAALDRYDVLDSGAEGEFDDLVRVIANICDVPIALITLIDNKRQWFKSALGTEITEIPRDMSFCTHAIQGGGVMMIEDAAADIRFAANPVVTDMGIRFYAGSPLETPDGFPLGTLCVLDRKPRQLSEAQQFALQTLSRQVMTMLEQRRNARFVRLLIDSSAEAFYAVDVNGVTTLCNTTFLRMMGFSHEENVIGLKLHGLIHHTHPDGSAYDVVDCPIYNCAREGGSAHVIDEVFYRLDGTAVPVEYWVKPLVIDGKRRGAICTFLDITERKQTEAAQKAAEAQLHQVAELREQFIAVLGHDLRNPLSAITSGIRLLQRDSTKERLELISGMMEQSVQRMSGLIDNVLDFARGRLGGGLSLVRKDVDLMPVLTHVIAELQTANPTQDIRQNISLQGPVNCNAGRIGQLLSNLLGNACAHGDSEAPIFVHATGEEKHLVLSVSNSGKKIPPEAIDNLFQPFTRGKIMPGQQGLGLGLFIAAEIAKAHNGEITVESTDRETRFTFRMPLTGN